jgi:predicted O-linked N-acetylglucosamine transferase (SPINDLY family)
MGVPLVTCRGNTFAGRVAASVISAVGVPELVTDTLEQYETLAANIARNPDLVGVLRTKLRNNRAACRLFDTDRCRRQLEAAFTRVWEIWEAGGEPKGFKVESL